MNPHGWLETESKRANDIVMQLIRGLQYSPYFSVQGGQLPFDETIRYFSLHDICRSVLGDFIPAQNQPRGTCVSRGMKRVLDIEQLIDVANRVAGATYMETDHAFIYASSRWYGGLTNYQDGSVGAWAAWSVANEGVLSYEMSGANRNNDDLAVQWGGPMGIPREIKSLAKAHLTRRVAKCVDFDDILTAIQNGYGVTIASTVGFEGRNGFTRNANGCCYAGGQWAHQMCYTGYWLDHPEGPCLLQDQSWGPNQPNGPTGPKEIPSYSFWTRKKDVERQLADNDCWLVSGLDGWQSRTLFIREDWTF